MTSVGRFFALSIVPASLFSLAIVPASLAIGVFACGGKYTESFTRDSETTESPMVTEGAGKVGTAETSTGFEKALDVAKVHGTSGAMIDGRSISIPPR